MLAAIIKYTKWLDFILCNVEINAQSGSGEGNGQIGFENEGDEAKVSLPLFCWRTIFLLIMHGEHLAITSTFHKCLMKFNILVFK